MSFFADFSRCWLALFEVIRQYIYFLRKKRDTELFYYF